MVMLAEVAPPVPQQMPTTMPFQGGLPDFITHHIDPLMGDDDSADVDGGSRSPFGEYASVATMAPTMPDGSPVPVPESRNALCPCGSGRKYKHCHGQVG